MFEIFAHSVVLCRKEGGIEDDAEGHGGVEDHVVDYHIEKVLKAEPEAVAGAAVAARRPIAVAYARFCRRERERKREKNGRWNVGG